MQGTSNATAKQLLETVSFELDTNLRLHPQKLSLGKAELLTDAITLPFIDIEKRLNQYICGSSDDEKVILQKNIKAYLIKLNANPMIPLHYRLKVLGRFEQELELFDAEMTTAVLNAHKIGVDLVRKAAKNEPAYFRILVDMVSNALELAVKMLRINLENYQSPAVLTIRQAFDLMRLGLSVAPVLQEEDSSERQRLFEIIGNHEMIRMLDFYSRSPHDQNTIWQELQHHVGILEPHFCHKGEQIKFKQDSFISIHCAHPNEAGQILSSLPSEFPCDMIIIPIDHFIDRLVTAIDRVESVLKDPDLQCSDLHTEEALHATILGGNAILNTIRNQERKNERSLQPGNRAILEWDASKALSDAHANMVLDAYEFAPSEHDNPDAWSIVNICSHGTGIERIGEKPPKSAVDSLVGISWLPHSNEPSLGIICWLKELKPGEQRLGIRFFDQNFKLYKAAMLGSSSDEITSKRQWPVLIQSGNNSHTALFPDCKIFQNMRFILSHNGKAAHFKVIKVCSTGSNYCFCDIKAIST
ncbi:MAG: hypothetical protein R8K49_05055 [Mariprofundaceae bacterium]